MHPSSSSSSTRFHHSIGAANDLLRYGTAPSSLRSPAVTTATTIPCFSAVSDGAKTSSSSGSDSARFNFPSHNPSSLPLSGRGRSTSLERSNYSFSCGMMMSDDDSRQSFGGDLRSAVAEYQAVSCCSSTGVDPPSSWKKALIRHSSSPADLLNRIASDIGFAVTKGIESYSTTSDYKLSRLSSQLSFNIGHSLSQISEVDVSTTGSKRGSQSSANIMDGFSLGPWDTDHSIILDASPAKKAKHNNGETSCDFTAIESQYSLPHAALDLAGIDNVIHIPEDSVSCRIRAKRGCATHPRSIAERERRTRISEKLKKLQDLVPNMDKQTSYADMLDLAVQHIKGLQTQIQQLNKELEHCKCDASRSLKNSFGRSS